MSIGALEVFLDAYPRVHVVVYMCAGNDFKMCTKEFA